MLKITHNAGFFSCCFVKLYNIIKYYKETKQIPLEVDSSSQFNFYKISNIDITYDFFEHYNNIDIDIDSILDTKNDKIINWDEQFVNFKTVDYKSIVPFIKKYFYPSYQITNICKHLQLKYNIDTSNCVALYYRGTDKCIETKLDTFDSYYNKLREIVDKYNTMQILIQTDSAQFLDYIKNKSIKNLIIINENTTSYTNNGIHKEKTQKENYIDIKNLFATFLIISKCKYIICSSSNGSIWIMYYRENANNVYQNLNTVWL